MQYCSFLLPVFPIDQKIRLLSNNRKSLKYYKRQSYLDMRLDAEDFKVLKDVFYYAPTQLLLKRIVHGNGLMKRQMHKKWKKENKT